MLHCRLIFSICPTLGSDVALPEVLNLTAALLASLPLPIVILRVV